jgi:hypothetical protein
MNKEKLYYDGIPPETAGAYQVQKFDTSGSAGNCAWASGLSTSLPSGPFWLELTALTKDVYVRFKPDNGTAGTTVDNGGFIPTGGTKKYFVDPVKHAYADIIASGVGTVLFQIVSVISGRNVI